MEIPLKPCTYMYPPTDLLGDVLTARTTLAAGGEMFPWRWWGAPWWPPWWSAEEQN